MCHPATFIPGHELSRKLFSEIVRPLLAREFPGLPYAATLLGAGSDVLGLDTPRSMDHDWAPRLNLLLADDDVAVWKTRILRILDTELPATFHGIPVDLAGSTQLPGDTPVLHHHASPNRAHGIRIESITDVLQANLGISTIGELDIPVWLTTPQQTLLELTSGPVFHDGIGEFTRVRQVLAWYPKDIWKHLMAAQWMRIAQLEAFVGRTGELADDTGSQVITLRIIEDAMHLAFLQERRYTPYAKWLGTAFNQLAMAASMQDSIDQARFATTWQERESSIIDLLTLLAGQHNRLDCTEFIDPAPQMFHDRPFRVIFAERFSRALWATVRDPLLQSIPQRIGGIDQFIDSTDARHDTGLRAALRTWLRSQGTTTLE